MGSKTQPCTAMHRRRVLHGIVGMTALSGCSDEGPGGEEVAEEDLTPEKIVGRWFNDNMGSINGVFDDIDEAETAGDQERWYVALKHYQDAFEEVRDFKETVSGQDADSGTERNLWSVAEDYFFHLEEGTALCYQGASDMIDGNDFDAETKFSQGYVYIGGVKEYADELNDELDGVLDDSIPTY